MTAPRLEPRDRLPERTLLVGIAVVILGLGTVMGVLYLGLWQGASEDLSRLLPASTRTHARLEDFANGLARALDLDLWRDRASMRAAAVASRALPIASVNAAPAPSQGPRPCVACGVSDLAGLPPDIARELLESMEGLELAWVPAGELSSLMLFVELRDPAGRKRILSRLRTHLETVGREVGFRIDRVRPRPWATLTGLSLPPPRLVDMEPWIVLSWGAAAPLEELLSARVGGRHDALHRRSGFTAAFEPGREHEHPLRLVVDARSLWQVLSGDAPLRAGGLVEFLDLVTLTSRLESGRDLLSARIEVSDRDLSRRLASALTTGPHTLIRRAPRNTLLAVSARGDQLPTLVDAMAQLSHQLYRDFAPELEDGVPESVVGLLGLLSPEHLGAVARALPETRAELLMLALPPTPDRIARGNFEPVIALLIRSDSPDALEAALAEAVPRWLGADWAHGEVLVDGERLYLERPHEDGMPIAWSRRDGVIFFAPDPETLQRLRDPAPPLLASQTDSELGLDTNAGLLLVAKLDLIPRTHPLARLLLDRVAPDALLAMALDAGVDRLNLRANFGLWALGAALASASPQELDDLLLADLSPACRQAYDALCALYPAAAPCQPLNFGRRAALAAVCEQLGR